MGFLVLDKYIGRKRQSRLTMISRGYQALKNENRLSLLLQLKNALSKTPIKSPHLLKRVSRQNNINMELSTRQYLTERILGTSFNESILVGLGSGSPVRHPLPLEWRKTLADKGIHVDNLSSALLWHGYGLIYWVKGVVYGLTSLLYLLKQKKKLGNSVYFSDLNKQCISTDQNEKNILNWYLRWHGRADNISSICHSVYDASKFKLKDLDVFYTDGLPRIGTLAIFQYVFFIIYFLACSLVRAPFQPLYGFLLVELLKVKRVELANSSELAGDYLFHNSTPLYRPIWTYIAEQRGSRVLFYFYSTNNENFQREGAETLDNPWHLINWPYYLVWDQYQADFVNRFNRNGGATIENVGPIWFSSDGQATEDLSSAVAVFDVFPREFETYITLGLDIEYYVPEVSLQFLEDVCLALNDNNMTVAHKVKRKSNFTHEKYVEKVESLKAKEHYIEIDPKIGAIDIIEKTKACISMPFTSTAIIAQSEGKPSVYYDPSGMLKKDDKAAHGITVLSDLDELRNWVSSL